MKKIMMTLAAVLCCAMATIVLTSCQKDEDTDEFGYNLTVEPQRPLTGMDAMNWRDYVLGIYRAELGTDSNGFTKHGTQEECDNEVMNACKRAETKLRPGGAGIIVVQNQTVNKTVYRRIIQ